MKTELSNMYDVILKNTAEAHIYFDYTVRIGKILEKNKFGFTPRTRFLNDMYEASLNYCAQCLMRLYDKTKRALSLVQFLKLLKKESSGNAYISSIDQDLATLEEDRLKNLLVNLHAIRNEKLFHIDLDNAKGKSSFDPSTDKPIAVNLEQMNVLVTSAVAIVSTYENLFNKPVAVYTVMSDSCVEVLQELERICFK